MKLSERDVKERNDIADGVFALIEGKKSKNIVPALIGAYTLVLWKGGYDKKAALSGAAEFIERWYAEKDHAERDQA